MLAGRGVEPFGARAAERAAERGAAQGLGRAAALGGPLHEAGLPSSVSRNRAASMLRLGDTRRDHPSYPIRTSAHYEIPFPAIAFGGGPSRPGKHPAPRTPYAGGVAWPDLRPTNAPASSVDAPGPIAILLS